MVPLKEREDRGRSIRSHMLSYIKTGGTGELERARDELVILMRLEGLSLPARQPFDPDRDMPVIPGLTPEEAADYIAAVEGGRS
jgi:hypothetical protein